MGCGPGQAGGAAGLLSGAWEGSVCVPSLTGRLWPTGASETASLPQELSPPLKYGPALSCHPQP